MNEFSCELSQVRFARTRGDSMERKQESGEFTQKSTFTSSLNDFALSFSFARGRPHSHSLSLYLQYTLVSDCFWGVSIFFLYIYSHLCRNRRLWAIVYNFLRYFIFVFYNNYSTCQFRWPDSAPEKLEAEATLGTSK